MRWLLSGTGPVRAIDQSVAAGRPPVDRPTLHFVDGRGLLLDAAARRLYLLNNSATLILSLLDEGQSSAAICRLLTDQYAVAPDAAARLVADVLRQLESAKGDSARGPAAAPPAPAFRRTQGHVAETRHYGLHRSIFRVDYGSLTLCEAVHPLLEALAIPAAPALPVAIEAAGRAVSIVADGREIGFAPTVDAAAVAVRASLTQLAVERSGGLCAVHAGALAANGGALLLPGHAGHGKSTLSAGLAADGFDMLSDDTTLLVGQPPRVASLPTGLCVKRGAYDVLAPLFPRLAGLPEWPRPDGLVAKYLMPDLDLAWAAPEQLVPARWLVFPHYDAGHATRLLPLPRLEALERLLPGVYFLSGTLDAANLDALIRWIEEIDCYELPLSSLDEAVALLRGLCR
jgi:hypothetical protein